MFDFDAGKLLVIGIVALIVIGPKELPRVLREVGQTVAKLRRMAAEFQSQFMDAIKESELEGIKEDLANITEAAKIEAAFDPVHVFQNEISEALTDPKATTIEGAPSLEMAGLPEVSAAEGPDFVEAGIAPVAEQSPIEFGPSVPPDEILHTKADQPEEDPAPVRKISGI